MAKAKLHFQKVIKESLNCLIPKFYKRPYEFRFIAGASNATTKKHFYRCKPVLEIYEKDPQRLL